jgi:SAM-dependent methyltransferase
VTDAGNQPPGKAADCCRAADPDPRIARYFDRRNSRRRSGAESYEMGRVTRRLLDLLLELGPAGHSVLDAGCGPAALLIGLLSAGASSGTGIDLSAAAIDYARERALAAGVAGRATFVVGDAASVERAVHDWVVLDKVICCYPDMAGLLERTLVEARSVYAFALPISNGWRGALAKLLLGAEGLVLRLLGRPCPAYVHDVGRIEAKLRAAGFGSLRSEDLGLWRIAVFARA